MCCWPTWYFVDIRSPEKCVAYLQDTVFTCKVWHGVYLQSVLVTVQSVLVAYTARCLPAKCLGNLHGTAFTCKVSWLPARHGVYLQSVLVTYTAWCLPAKCAVYLQGTVFTGKVCCLPDLHGMVFTCKMCCLPTRHGVYLQSVLVTYTAWCLPAKCVVYLQGMVFTCSVCLSLAWSSTRCLSSAFLAFSSLIVPPGVSSPSSPDSSLSTITSSVCYTKCRKKSSG